MKYLFIIFLFFVNNIFSFSDSLTVISKDIYKCLEDTSVFVKISYPQIENLKNKEVQDKINLFLEIQFLQALDNYEDFISDTESLAEYPPDWFFNFETSYKINYLSDDFLSVTMEYYEYTGGAHGNHSIQSFNIRLSDGENLTLGDIIKENQFENLSLFCEQEILKMLNANSLIEGGLFEDEINITPEQDFYIKPGYLVLQFDPYEIAPYAFGSIEIELSFERIKNLLKSKLPFKL